MKVSVLGLAGLLLLTGCSSSPSMEAQTQLVEYEKCLDNAINKSNLLTRTSARVNTFLDTTYTDYHYDMKNDIKALISQCESLRP